MPKSHCLPLPKPLSLRPAGLWKIALLPILRNSCILTSALPLEKVGGSDLAVIYFPQGNRMLPDPYGEGGSMKEILGIILEVLKVLRELLALIRDRNTRHDPSKD